MSMGINLGSNIPFKELERNFLPNLVDYYKNPAHYYLPPFKIYGNLYYIGDKKVCSHLIDTGDGLILFDSGYQHTIHQYLQSIWELGFNPKEVKYVIHGHGHFDHFGAGKAMKDLFGCKLFLSKVDSEHLRSNPELALMEYNPDPYAEIIIPDYEIDDGEVITLGNTSIRCVLAPGHTEGTLAFFFNAIDKGMSLKVGYIGGIGFLTLYKEYLRKYNLPSNMQDQFRITINMLRPEKPGITLGNHPWHNGTIEKRNFMLSHPESNPFIDSEVWIDLLDGLEKRLNDFQLKGY